MSGEQGYCSPGVSRTPDLRLRKRRSIQLSYGASQNPRPGGGRHSPRKGPANARYFRVQFRELDLQGVVLSGPTAYTQVAYESTAELRAASGPPELSRSRVAS